MMERIAKREVEENPHARSTRISHCTNPKAHTLKSGRKFGSMKRVAGEALAKCSCCNHFVCVKTITYPLRLEQTLYKRVKREADRREKKLSDTFRDLISYGFETLPPLTDKSELVAEIWDKLGPAPEILYENYKRGDVSPTI